MRSDLNRDREVLRALTVAGVDLTGDEWVATLASLSARLKAGLEAQVEYENVCTCSSFSQKECPACLEITSRNLASRGEGL